MISMNAPTGPPSPPGPPSAETRRGPPSAETRRGPPSAEMRPDPPEPANCAWVVLLMNGVSYLPGALVVARTLRDVQTRHALVCMVTQDVPSTARAQLRGTAHAPLFDEVVEVPLVSHPTRPFRSKKQAELYGGWIDRSFTKWNCLTLTRYARVLLVDADMAFVANCDDLFALPPPAACYSYPWARPYTRGGVANHYLGHGVDLPHGTRIPARQIFRALRSGSFVGWGALVLLEPSTAMFEGLLASIRAEAVFGAEYNSVSGADEVSIAAFYAGVGDWTHIHQQYLAIPWKLNWVARAQTKALHYHGRNPWDMNPDEWPDDLSVWWGVAASLVRGDGMLRPVFYPALATPTAPALATPALAAAAYRELQLTNDLRGLILGRLPRRPDSWPAASAVLGRWIVAIIDSRPAAPEPAWASIYHRGAGATCTALARDLAGGLGLPPADAEGVATAMLSLIANRLAAPPCTPGAVAYDGTTLAYGPHFKTAVTPRIKQLIRTHGPEKIVSLAIRQAALAGERGISQALADRLYEKCGVRNEAFASPLDARLSGKEGGAFFSASPDTGAEFGSAGDFFGTDLDFSIYPGNWLVYPPAGSWALRAAHAAIGALGTCPRSVFFITPDADPDVLEALRACPYYAGSRSGGAILEPPADRGSGGPATLVILSTEPPDIRAAVVAAALA